MSSKKQILQNSSGVNLNTAEFILPGLIELREPRKRIITMVLSFVIAILTLSGIILYKVKKQALLMVGDSLQSITSSAQHTLDIWSQDLLHETERMTSDTGFVKDVEALARIADRKQPLLNNRLNRIRGYLKPFLAHRHRRGFFIINQNLINIASHNNHSLGEKNILGNVAGQQIERALYGEQVFIPPSGKASRNGAGIRNAEVSMFIASPVINSAKKVIAVLIIEFDPIYRLNQIARIGAFGDSGETYLINKKGEFLTESRFVKQLQQAGYLEKNLSTILNLQAVDPGYNILTKAKVNQQKIITPGKLTYAAKMVLQQMEAKGESRLDIFLEPYSDYRGITVLGAWFWNQKLELGIITKIDESEALRQYSSTWMVVIIVFLLVMALTFGFVYLFLWTRRQHQAKTVHNQKLLLRTQEIARLGSWEWYSKSNRMVWSPEIYKILGYDPTTTTPSIEKFLNRIHADDRELIYDLINNSVVENVFNDCVHRIIRLDGAIGRVRQQGEIYFSKTRNEKVLLGVMQDITERFKIEVALRQSKVELERRVEMRTAELKKLSHALENSPSAVVITNYDGIIEYVNPQFAEDSGYSRAEAVGQKISMMDADNMTPEDYNRLWNKISSGQKWVGEFHNRQKNGHRYWVLAAISPLKNELGQITHFVSTQENMDYLKRSESKLEIAREEAEKANRAKSEFLSRMSHELRTPMNAILGFAQLMKDNPEQPLSDDQESYIEFILKGGYHLLELINEILDLSRIESGNFSLSLENIDPTEIITECMEFIKSMAESKQIQIQNNANGKSYKPLLADRTRLMQILLNLMSNGIKYNNPNGTLSVDIQELSFENKLYIAISDTGPGIPNIKQASIFEPFNRLGAEDSSIEGTGIGLTITKKLTEMMGGKIGFESSLGEGSTFWVKLPLAINSKAITGSPEEIENMITAEMKKSSYNILHIEDNVDNQLLFRNVVERIGSVNLIEADNAESGIELAIERKPDLIFIDINLPGISGFEAMEKMKIISSISEIPVVAISANAMPDDIKRGLELGFRTYITKPINIPETIKIIKSILTEKFLPH